MSELLEAILPYRLDHAGPGALHSSGSLIGYVPGDRGQATQLGAIVHAVGGVEDHVHLAVSVPPSLAVSEFTGQIKGNSSHFANHEPALPDRFAWQAEYGVVSFDARQLAKVAAYVRDQRLHHGQGAMVPVLERSMSDSLT